MRPHAMLIAGLLAGNTFAQPQTLPGANAPGSVPGLGTMPAMPGQNPGSTLPPVGTTTSPGTSTQIFPHPPTVPPVRGGAGLAGSPAPAYGSTYSPPAYGSNSAPVTATAPALPGYAAPGTAPLPGYTAPPGSAGFPPVTSVPSPGLPLTPDSGLMTGSGGTAGVGASGSGSAIDRAIRPPY